LAIIGVFLGWAPRGDAESLDDIKSLSVTVSWTQAETGYNEFGVRFRLPRDRSIKLYISSKGNIFEYPAASNNWRYGPTVSAVDKATDLISGHWGQGQMMVWAMMDGHLKKIAKAIQGFSVLTVAIDPARLSCTFDAQIKPDPQTGMYATDLTGPVIQLEALEVISYSCTVKKGNIFASTSE
jgi:hypothetical protein